MIIVIIIRVDIMRLIKMHMYSAVYVCMCSRRLHTICALGTVVHTCVLPIFTQPGAMSGFQGGGCARPIIDPVWVTKLARDAADADTRAVAGGVTASESGSMGSQRPFAHRQGRVAPRSSV